MKRKYRVVYQLGGGGRVMHRKLSSAIAAVHAAAAACRKGGDLQGVSLQAYEQDSSGHYWEADLTDEERDQIAAR